MIIDQFLVDDFCGLMIGELLKGHALLQQGTGRKGIFTMVGDHLLIVQNRQVVLALAVEALSHIIKGLGSLRSVGVGGQ